MSVGRVGLDNLKRQESLIAHIVFLMHLQIILRKEEGGSRVQHWRALGTLVQLNRTLESGTTCSRRVVHDKHLTGKEDVRTAVVEWN